MPAVTIAETGGHDAETGGHVQPKCAVTLPKRAVTMGRNTQAEAARRDKERLGPLASQKAKLLEGLTLEQVYARWAEVMGSRSRVGES